MKTLSTIIVLIASISNMLMADELKVQEAAFGTGKHKIYDSETCGSEVISRLVKGGYEYSVEYDQSSHKITRCPEADKNQIENIVNFNYRLYLGICLQEMNWLVDVHATNTEIAFLIATGSGYEYFKVTNQNVIVPNGYFLCEREGINSTNWKLIQVQLNPSPFGEGFLDWQHSDEIDSIKLLNINNIEVKKKNTTDPLVMNVTENTIEVGGVAIENVKLLNPMLENEEMVKEIFLGEDTTTNEDVKFHVSFYKGGKDFVLNTLLIQLSDQNAANLIREKINAAYVGN